MMIGKGTATVLATLLIAGAFAPTAMAGNWLIEGNAGVGIPTGNFGDDWGSGLLVGANLGYMSSPFEIGADISYLKNNPSGDFETFLDATGQDGDFSFMQYGVHARWMPTVQSALSPFLGVGLGAYNVKEQYSDALSEEETSKTVVGVHGGGGVNYWVSRTWGLGVEAAYHSALTNEGDFSYDSPSYIAVTGGLRWKLGATQ